MAAKQKPASFWAHIPFRNFFYLSLFFNIAIIVIIFLIRSFLPPVVPLFYGRPEGEGQLIPTLGLAIAPLAALVLSAVNLILTKLVKDEFIRQILIISTFLISLLTFITVIKIIFLVGFF